MCTQAAPHVSGLLAYLIGRRMEGFEPETSPQVAKIRLQQIARRGVLQGVRQYLDLYHKGTTQSPQASTHLTCTFYSDRDCQLVGTCS